MIKTVKEVIEQLNTLGDDEVVLYNIYSIKDLRESIDSFTDVGEVKDLTDSEVLKKFNDIYGSYEDEWYWRACADIGNEIDKEAMKEEESLENE